MLKSRSNQRVILAWRQAAVDLNIKIQSPFFLTTSDNRTIKIDLLIENFGNKLGTIILSTEGMSYFRIAEQSGYYCSALNPDRYSIYDLEHFIATLNDWGYFGDPLHKPHWYSGQVWS